MSQYLRRFNYPNNWIFPSVGLYGGISLLWKRGFNLEIVDNSDKMINAIISYDPSKPEFLVTFSMVLYTMMRSYNNEITSAK